MFTCEKGVNLWWFVLIVDVTGEAPRRLVKLPVFFWGYFSERTKGRRPTMNQSVSTSPSLSLSFFLPLHTSLLSLSWLSCSLHHNGLKPLKTSSKTINSSHCIVRYFAIVIKSFILSSLFSWLENWMRSNIWKVLKEMLCVWDDRYANFSDMTIIYCIHVLKCHIVSYK